MKYVNESSEAYRVYHRTPVDPREWVDPKKVKEEEEDDEVDDDGVEHNKQKPYIKQMKKLKK